MNYIPRKISALIEDAALCYQVIVITGPRQTGKTTLARHLFGDYAYYNLEDPTQRMAVEADPRDLESCGVAKLQSCRVAKFQSWGVIKLEGERV